MSVSVGVAIILSRFRLAGGPGSAREGARGAGAATGGRPARGPQWRDRRAQIEFSEVGLVNIVVVVAAVVAGQRVAEPIGEGGVYADHLGNRLPRRTRHCGTKGVVQNSNLMNEPTPLSLSE